MTTVVEVPPSNEIEENKIYDIQKELEKFSSFELEQFNDEIFRLLLDEPFFAEFSLHLLKYPSTSIPTAAVGFSRAAKSFYLIYNPNFLRQLDHFERKTIFIHEFCHLCLDHLTFRSQNHGFREVNNSIHRIINGGMDCAINSMPMVAKVIPRNKLILWDSGPDAGKKTYFNPWMPGEGSMKDALPEQSTEYYIDFIKSRAIDTSSYDEMDDHGFGDPMEGPESVIAKEKIINSIKSAIRKAEEIKNKSGNHQKGWGSISEAMAKQIIELAKSHPPSPEEVLKHFLDSIGRGSPKSTWTKQNRRLPGQRPRRKYKLLPNVVIAVDQSGSVSDEMLGYFFDILNKYSSKFEFTYVPFDTAVYKDTVSKLGKYKKSKKERELCGGTDFNAPTAYVNTNRQYDGLIICTDMYAPLPVRSRVPRLWFTNVEGQEYFRNQGCQEPIIALKNLK